MSVRTGFIPSQHPRNPSNGRFVSKPRLIAPFSGTTFRSVRTTRGTTVTRSTRRFSPSTKPGGKIASGRPGTGHGRRAREAAGRRARTAAARGGMVGTFRNGKVSWRKRGPRG